MILCAISLLVTLIFMDNLKYENKTSKDIKIVQRFKNEISNLIKLFIKIDLWLLFSLTFYNGFEITFIWFEYSRVYIFYLIKITIFDKYLYISKAFATCLLGVNYVGWSNMVFGSLASFLSFGMTYFLKYVGVQIGIVFMLMVSLMHCVFILSWTPTPEGAKILVFIMAIGFALSMSVS